MGVVRRQSLKHSLVNLSGLAIGGLSVLFLYPFVKAEYGLMQYLLQAGMIGLPLLTLGGNTVVFRFFPRFQNKSNGHNGLLPLLMFMCLTGFLLCGIIVSFFWSGLRARLETNSPLLHDYLWMAIPLAFFYVISIILSQYSANFKRIVVPSILVDFSQKIVLPILLASILFGWVTLQTALWLLLFHAILVTFSMVFYLRWLGEWYWRPNFAFLTPELRKEMLRFIVFGAFGGFALLMAAKSDLFLVGSTSSLDKTGIYAIVAYVAAAIDIPTKGLYSASVALVSRHLADENMADLGILYRKVSINLLVAGLLIFGGVWVSVDDLFRILPHGQEMLAGKYVLLFIGLSRLAEMGTGLNNYLIYYSKYYIYSLISLGILAVANVCFSLWLIPKWGISGAAFSTMGSIMGYNLVSLIMVWVMFKLQPFTRNTLVAIALALAAFGVAYFIPHPANPWLALILRSGAYALIFGGLVLLLRVSPDLNDTIKVIRNKLRRAG